MGKGMKEQSDSFGERSDQILRGTQGPGGCELRRRSRGKSSASSVRTARARRLSSTASRVSSSRMQAMSSSGRRRSRGWPAHKIAHIGITRTFQIMRPYYSPSRLKNLIIPLWSPAGTKAGRLARRRQAWRQGHGRRRHPGGDRVRAGFEGPLQARLNPPHRLSEETGACPLHLPCDPRSSSAMRSSQALA